MGIYLIRPGSHINCEDDDYIISKSYRVPMRQSKGRCQYEKNLAKIISDQACSKGILWNGRLTS